MYKSGELIHYGEWGVCRITDVSEKDMPGREATMYYTLKPLYHDCVINTPVNAKVFMRPIIDRDEAERLIDTIPTMHAEAYACKHLNQLVEHYKESLNSYDCAELIELSMSIYAKKQIAAEQKRKFGTVDERFMKRAEELLFGELAAALGIPRDDVPQYINERVGMEAVVNAS